MDNEMDISVKNWYSQGWNTFKKNPKQLIYGSIAIVIYSSIITYLGVISNRYWIIMISAFFISPVLGVGWLFLCLNLVRGKNENFLIILSAFKKYGKVWLTSILLYLIVGCGTVLLIFPGIIWGLKYGMSLFLVMDKSLFARSAFRYSNRMTKGYRKKLFVAILLAVLLTAISYPFSFGLQKIGGEIAPILLIAGALPFLAYMLIIAPWVGVTAATAYEDLLLINEKKTKGIELEVTG